MGLVRLSTRVIGFVSEIVCVWGVKDTPLNWFGVETECVVVQVI